jgi:hypothetical protein
MRVVKVSSQAHQWHYRRDLMQDQERDDMREGGISQAVRVPAQEAWQP